MQPYVTIGIGAGRGSAKKRGVVNGVSTPNKKVDCTKQFD